MSDRTPFAKWLNRKFLEWQTEEGETKYLSDFADELGFPAPVVSMWMSGKRTPQGFDVIQKLAQKLGSEVYNIVTTDPKKSDWMLEYIIANWDKLPPDKQLEFKRLIDEAGQ